MTMTPFEVLTDAISDWSTLLRTLALAVGLLRRRPLDSDVTGTLTINRMYTSPVPMPGEPAPPIYREIYPMPMFVILPTADLAASKDFWINGLGFVDLFSTPDQVTHLRRWAFQDVLLVPGSPEAGTPAGSVSFSCMLGQLDEIAARCEELAPGCTSGPEVKPWNCTELTVTTPENATVVMTGAHPFDPNSEAADWMREQGIDIPQ